MWHKAMITENLRGLQSYQSNIAILNFIYYVCIATMF